MECISYHVFVSKQLMNILLDETISDDLHMLHPHHTSRNDSKIERVLKESSVENQKILFNLDHFFSGSSLFLEIQAGNVPLINRFLGTSQIQPQTSNIEPKKVRKSWKNGHLNVFFWDM